MLHRQSLTTKTRVSVKLMVHNKKKRKFLILGFRRNMK